MTALDVLFEDNHCLAVNKPARLLTVGDRTGEESLLERAKAYLKDKYQKPGNVFLGVVHRLDRPVSGVVLFARTSKAAGRLSEQLRQHAMRKVYHAVVEGNAGPGEQTCVDWLLKDRTQNVVRVVAEGTPESQRAELRFRRLKSAGGRSLLEVVPVTGRSHQIRVQLASRGLPIVGDRKYGSQEPRGGVICLHARSLEFLHPTSREPVCVVAPYPPHIRLRDE